MHVVHTVQTLIRRGSKEPETRKPADVKGGAHLIWPFLVLLSFNLSSIIFFSWWHCFSPVLLPLSISSLFTVYCTPLPKMFFFFCFFNNLKNKIKCTGNWRETHIKMIPGQRIVSFLVSCFPPPEIGQSVLNNCVTGDHWLFNNVMDLVFQMWLLMTHVASQNSGLSLWECLWKDHAWLIFYLIGCSNTHWPVLSSLHQRESGVRWYCGCCQCSCQ